MATSETAAVIRTRRPVLALAMGDPAGISSELTAKILSLPELCSAAHFIVIGDRRILEEGALIAKVDARSRLSNGGRVFDRTSRAASLRRSWASGSC